MDGKIQPHIIFTYQNYNGLHHSVFEHDLLIQNKIVGGMHEALPEIQRISAKIRGGHLRSSCR